MTKKEGTITKKTNKHSLQTFKKISKKRKNESRLVTYNRRRGQTTRAVCIKQRRCQTMLRRIRKDLPESFMDLLSNTKHKKRNISPSYTIVMTGALDATANEIMEMARRFARHRVGVTGTQKPMKMLRRDLEQAILVNRKLN